MGAPSARLGFRLPADVDSRLVLSTDRPGCARVECPMGTPPAARWHSAADRLRPLLQGRRHSDRARLQAGRAFGVRRVWHPARRNTTRGVQRGDPISCLPDCERRALRRRRQHLCRTRRLLNLGSRGRGGVRPPHHDTPGAHPHRPRLPRAATPRPGEPALALLHRPDVLRERFIAILCPKPQ